MSGIVRKLAIALLQGVLFSNGFIALCAAVMCWTTAFLFDLILPAFFLPFIFLATLSSYSLHWYLTPVTSAITERNQWNRQHKPVLLRLLIGSALLGLALLTQLLTCLPYFVPVVVATFLYTAPKINHRPFRYLRRIAILKTAYLAFIWTVVTAVLPLWVGVSDWNNTSTVWAINRFLFIYSVCFLFDYRDRETDRQSRWLTLVSMMTKRKAVSVFYSIAGFFTLSLTILYQIGMPFRYTLCLGTPMFLFVVTTHYAPAWKSDYWYYLYLDGLMMLSGLLLLIN